MRSRNQILTNLETAYREAFEQAQASHDERRMRELDWSYLRDQLLMEVLLDIRDQLGTRTLKP